MRPHLEDEAKMKKSKLSETHIGAILKETEAGVPSAEVARKHRVSAATLYAWKSLAGTRRSDTRVSLITRRVFEHPLLGQELFTQNPTS